jgi:hypothetical protein
VKEEFHEDMLSDERDPIDANGQGFDWQQLYQRLGEDASSAENDRKLAEAVVRLLEVLVSKTDKPMHPQSVGLRVIALAWVLNPGYFDGSPSLRELAERCRVKPATLGRFTGEVSRFIRWRNRAQRHAWNWHAFERSDLR